jgi:hypothetical protein
VASPNLALPQISETFRLLQAFAAVGVMLWLAVVPFILIGYERSKERGR